MKSRLLIIIGIAVTLTIIFFIFGPSQGHIAQYFLSDEQFEDLVLNSDNDDRYSTYEKSLTINPTPQECADLFDKIHQEFKDTPCACCNPAPGEPVCEPIGFDDILAHNKEFRDSGCEFIYRDWIHLTNDIKTASWWMYPSYFNIDMLKTNLSKEIPIEVSYRGYDNCISLKVVIYNHGEHRPIVSERDYENICPINENGKYELPIYTVQLTDYGEPIILPKGDYQLILYNLVDDQIIDEESESVGQFFFSSYYDQDAQLKELDYDYTKPASDVLRESRCTEWFDKIMYTSQHTNNPDFDLKYELTETNVFRDLKCASIVSNWEPLTDNDVWDIGISWKEIIKENEK